MTNNFHLLILFVFISWDWCMYFSTRRSRRENIPLVQYSVGSRFD
jgi:hypothetical protein